MKLENQVTQQNQSVEHSGICLNVGCWIDAPDGWENIDASPSVKLATVPLIGRFLVSAMGGPDFPKSVKYGDLIKGLSLKPNSCELIFASHVLEHLSLSDFHTSLNNIYAYLQPGGIFRVIIPDLEQYVAKYTKQRSEGTTSAKAASTFMQASCLGHQRSRTGLKHRFHELLSNSRHQWMWDEPSLTEALIQHGFKNVRRCQFGDWSDPRFGLVERQDRHWEALCLEATK